MAKWKDVKTVATIAPDYAYGRDSIAAFIASLKKLRPDIQIVDQEWPKLGEADFTPFITAQMGKKPDAVYCSLFAGDFVTFTKEATPLGYFKAINNRMIDGAEVGTADEAQALGNDYPYGIIADAYDPVVWAGRTNRPSTRPLIDEPARRSSRPNTARAGRSSATKRSRRWPMASRRPATPRATTSPRRLLGLTFDTPVGKRTFSVKSHETLSPEYWGVMTKEAAYPFAVIKNPELLPASFHDQLTSCDADSASPASTAATRAARESWGIDRRWRPRFCSASSWAA